MSFLSITSYVLAIMAGGAYADHGFERAADFPDAPDGSTLLAVDLHTHSVFSDGHVWPTIRVEEADRDGLDAIASTEHLEHQPKAADIPHPDRNRSWQIAREDAEKRGIDLMTINGAEITRDMPPGHVNAVFVSDANALLADDAEAAITAANTQGAFVFWNHPNWLPQAPDGVARMLPFHQRLVRAGKLHGVEVANGTLDAYSEHAFQIALDYNLTVLGTSDIHGLVDWTHDAGHGGHRPMTIVLAPERSELALKQALFDGRTVAWARNDLIGRKANVEQVVKACLTLEPEVFLPRSTVLQVSLKNACPLAFTLKNEGALTFHNVSDLVRVERYDSIPLQIRMGTEVNAVSLDVTVLNSHVRPREQLRTILSAKMPVRPNPTNTGP